MKSRFSKTAFILFVLTTFLATFSTSQVAFSAKKKHKKPRFSLPPDPPSVMKKFLQTILSLQEYMVSEKKFDDPANNEKIKVLINDLAKYAQDAEHVRELQSPGYKVSREILEEHIKDSAILFNDGKKSFARWKLNATYSICISCHTQLPVSSQRRYQMYKNNNITSLMDQGEFLFLTRQFEDALKIYDQVITQFPSNTLTPQQVETALERKLAIFTRIKQDDLQAMQDFQQSLSNTQLPPFLIGKIKAWVKAFEKISKRPKFALYTNSESLRTYFTKFIAEASDAEVDEKTVYYQKITGQLFEYLSINSQGDMIAESLYWLGVSYRFLDRNLFFSLGEVYLKECMQKFSTTAIAKKCYGEYEDQIIASYSGSSGTNLPPEVQKELNDWKTKAYGNPTPLLPVPSPAPSPTPTMPPLAPSPLPASPTPAVTPMPTPLASPVVKKTNSPTNLPTLSAPFDEVKDGNVKTKDSPKP